MNHQTIRTRTRTPVPPVTNLDELIGTVFRENKKMNTAKSAYEGARKVLYKQMLALGLKTKNLTIVGVDGEQVEVEALISKSVASMISVEALRKLVPEEMFMKIVSATKKDVEAYAGTIVATAATVTGNGTENVSVKEVKESKEGA